MVEMTGVEPATGSLQRRCLPFSFIPEMTSTGPRRTVVVMTDPPTTKRPLTTWQIVLIVLVIAMVIGALYNKARPERCDYVDGGSTRCQEYHGP